MVDGGEEEHVARVDEALVLVRNFFLHDECLHHVGHVAGVEFGLQASVLGSIKFAHVIS